MARRSPLGDAVVQAFLSVPNSFVRLANGNAAEAKLASLLTFDLTDTQRDQVLWAVEKRILKARGFSPARCLDTIGQRQYGPNFSPEATHALTDAVTGNAGPKVTKAADGLYALMTAAEKAEFVPP